MPTKTNLSKDALEVIGKMADLTTQLALTNQSLSNVGSTTKKLEDVVYGNAQGDGGLLVSVKEHDKLLNDPETGVVKQMLDLVKHCNTVVGAVESQAASIHNLNKVVYTIGFFMIILLLGLGVVGWKDVQAFFNSLHSAAISALTFFL